MRPFYTRISSIQSFQLSNVIPSTTKPESVASGTSWMEMMQQNNKVETVIQALPDQRTFKDALHAVNWISVRYWLTVIALLLLALGAALAPPIAVGRSSRDSYPADDHTEWIYAIEPFICHPDGSLQLPWAETVYNPWAITSILDINMGFGPMPFALVKFIDVVWDLVVGRGGQALLSVLVYRVLSQALLFSMETRRSSFRKFAATSFESGSASALRVYVQDLFMDRRARGICSTMLVLAFVITTAYVIAFPTIISGISGYQAVSTPKCTDPSGDGKMIDTSTARLSQVTYNITDGSRIGLSDNYLWTLELDTSPPFSYMRTYCNVSQELSSKPVCPQNRTSVFGYHRGDYYGDYAKNLTAPTLNIQLVHDTLFLYGDELENQTISQTYLEKNTKCYPGSSYRWGFSSLGLFLWLVFTSLFAISLYAIWAPTYMFSRLDRNGRSLGLYRAVVDMASALREEFGDDCDTMSDAQFQKQLKTRDAGIKVDPEDLPEPRYNDMKPRKWKAFNKIGRYQALRRERAASRAFAET